MPELSASCSSVLQLLLVLELAGGLGGGQRACALLSPLAEASL